MRKKSLGARFVTGASLVTSLFVNCVLEVNAQSVDTLSAVESTAVEVKSKQGVTPSSALDNVRMRSSDASSSAHFADKAFTIYMILWNGKTKLESSFIKYLERRNVKVNYIRRDCAGSKEKCRALIPEIRDSKPDLIYIWSTPAAEAIGGTIDATNRQEYIWDIPIIALIVTDPVASRLIYSLDKPGRNITGVNHTAPVDSQLNAMKEYVAIKNIAAIFNPNESNSISQVKSLEEEAKKSKIWVHRYPLPLNISEEGVMSEPNLAKLSEFIKQIAQEKPDFIYMPADNFLAINCQEVVIEANKYKIPTFGATDLMFDNGRPLMGLLSRFTDVGEFAGFKAYQILVEGRKVEDIPYEKLKGFSFLISKNTYEEVGLYPPIKVLKFAEIIEGK